MGEMKCFVVVVLHEQEPISNWPLDPEFIAAARIASHSRRPVCQKLRHFKSRHPRAQFLPMIGNPRGIEKHAEVN